MTYLVWDGSSLFEKDGSLVKVGEDECCCITTTGSTASTSGSTDSGGSDSTSDSDSGTDSGSTTGYGSEGSSECVVDGDCCVCNYRIEKEPCSLEGCPDGWIDDGFFCVFQSEFYVNCESGASCPAAPIDDLGEVECCEGWNEESEGGYDGDCAAFTEESGVCCDGECKEDCCDYRAMPEETDNCDDQSCEWDWDGSQWNKDFDGCEGDCVCIEPSTPGYNIGDSAETQCNESLLGCDADLQIELDDGTIYCCPEGCPPDQEYDPSTYSGDGPCCCENPDCECYCGCGGSFPCTEAEGGGQAACEAIGPTCVFEPESSPGADDCGCDCGFTPTDFAGVDDDCSIEGVDVNEICGPDSECVQGAWDLSCDEND